ncbi:MAG TPA: pyridoxal phosphate-dependent aminotransferase [Thermoanaerobaculia bacterium]|nr:pyridoxal phosphate-dependent aminotransferase [Thermoanaerobaculia bacterium]
MADRGAPLSRRLQWEQAGNFLAAAVAARRGRGLTTIDLTETNPTRVGLSYPESELAELLRRSSSADYPPHPLGIPEAREVLAAALSRRHDPVAPEDLVLTASTSEAYSYLFKLFGDPGDEVLAAAPAYPLLDELAPLDGLVLRHFPLEPGRRFALDVGEIESRLAPRSRLLALVHPANPTGSFLTQAEQDAVVELCASRGLPWISDEVFADYALDRETAAGGARAVVGVAGRAGAAAARQETLCFSLGGLSKSAGLPGWKLGWIRAGGPAAERRRIVAALERLADAYLSVATPVQRALGGVLALAPQIRAAILDRLRRNLAALETAFAGLPAVSVLEPEAGWSAVLRVPRLVADEELVAGALRQAGVLVHPGYFFDFPSDGFLVLSLLPDSGNFDEGVHRLAAYLSELMSASEDTEGNHAQDLF